MKNFKARLLIGASVLAIVSSLAACGDDDDKVIERNTTNTVIVDNISDINKADTR